MIRTPGKYDHMKCVSCGVPLELHEDSCFRHKFLFQAIWDRKSEILLEDEAKRKRTSNGQLSEVAEKMRKMLTFKEDVIS